jgi:hypothetical protein
LSEQHNGTVAAVDLNGDGNADVAALFDTISNSTLVVYLGNGDGTFKAGTSYDLGSTSALVLSFADFNGDNKTDIAVSDTGQEMVLLGNGDGTFQSARISAGVSHPADAAVGDFNGDGKLDLALDGAVLLGNGDGTFQAPLNTGAGGAAGDLNGDGELDLVDGTHIYLGNGDGTFSDTGHAYLVHSHSNTAIADFNADGKLDIAVGNTVLMGNGNGTFQGSPSSVGSLYTLEAFGTVVGHFDKNGTVDVAVAVLNYVTVLLNDGTGQLSVTQTYTLQKGYANTMVTGDFNDDGNLDLIVVVYQREGGDPPSLSYSVLLGNGDGTFQPPAFYSVGGASGPNYPASVVVGDFNNDGKLDFAVDLSNSLFLGNGDGTFAAPIYMSDQGADLLVSGDFNGDGKLDVTTICQYFDVGTALLFGNGDGSFQAPVFPPNLQGFYPRGTADLNHDGKPDLISDYFSGSSSGSFSQVALGNGDGTFTLLPSFPQYVVAIADLNGDGRPDAVYEVAGDIIQTGLMLGNGDGTFGSPSNVFASTGDGRALVAEMVADMNGDGRADLVFVASGAVGVLLNTTQPGFELSATALSPTATTAGNSATSTVNVIRNFGFSQTVTLSCVGLPTGATCAFNPPSIANSSGSSALTITTTSNTAAGTYSIQVQGTAGSVVNSAAVALVVEAVPDFSFGPAAPSSQTVAPGQAATFVLTLSPSGSFTGTVNLSCAITPNVSAAPTCSVPPSVQISGSGSQSVTVSVGTTAPVTTSALPHLGLPPTGSRLRWTYMLLATVLLCSLSRRRISVLARATVVMTMVWLAACGGTSGNGSASQGTPAGSYTTTITASSGTLSHRTTLTVVVQ